MEGRKQFSDLNDDCIRQVVQLLPWKDLKQFSLVNKQCRALSLDVLFKVAGVCRFKDWIAPTFKSFCESRHLAEHMQ
jgi:hypothetical protein